MKLILMGYMGSGKSTIGAKLSDKLNYDFLDLDSIIEKNEGKSISDIFDHKGAIYFRKRESQYLNEVLVKNENLVLALGGGTPCYGDNLESIKTRDNVITIYLKGSIPFLTKRLFKEKSSRPLISQIETKDKLSEFMGKHLFERSVFYQQADHIIDIDEKSPEELVEDILLNLF